MADFLTFIAFTNLVFGIISLSISGFFLFPWEIEKIGLKRTGWRKYGRGYTLAKLREARGMTSNIKLHKKLDRRIIATRVGYHLILSAPILIVISAFFD
ncbi:MAG: hypothetical protein AB8F78_10770 [Saprospiraceae bacterium]